MLQRRHSITLRCVASAHFEIVLPAESFATFRTTASFAVSLGCKSFAELETGALEAVSALRGSRLALQLVLK